jgi:hypothetical protein
MGSRPDFGKLPNSQKEIEGGNLRLTASGYTGPGALRPTQEAAPSVDS